MMKRFLALALLAALSACAPAYAEPPIPGFSFWGNSSSSTAPAQGIPIYPSEVTVTYGTTTTFDFSTFINAVVTLTGNITTMNTANIKAGQAGTITFIQDGSGSRTAVWNSNFKFAGGITPVLSSAPNAIDILAYSCRTTSFCVAALTLNVH